MITEVPILAATEKAAVAADGIVENENVDPPLLVLNDINPDVDETMKSLANAVVAPVVLETDRVHEMEAPMR